MQLHVADGTIAAPQASPLFPTFYMHAVAESGQQQVVEELNPLAFAPRPVTLVTVAFQALGQRQLDPWHQAFEASCSPVPLLASGTAAHPHQPALLNVVYLHGWLFKILKRLLLSSVHRGIGHNISDKTVAVFSSSDQATDVRSSKRSRCAL